MENPSSTISPKKSWKNKRIKLVTFITILAVTFVMFLFVVVPLFLRIDYLLGAGFVLYVKPVSKSLSMHYGDKTEIEFNVSAKNPFYCKAECSYSFYDQSKGVAADFGNATISHKEYILKRYNVTVSRIGSGQDLYTFQVSCRNKRTYLCWTPKDETKISSALVVVNYNLSEELSRIKDSLKSSLTSFLEMLSETDAYAQMLNRNILELGLKGNLNSLSPAKEKLSNELGRFVLMSEKFHAMWNSEDYVNLKEEFNESFFANISNIRTQADNLGLRLNQTIERHNLIVGQIRKLTSETSDAASVIPSIMEDKQFAENINKTIDSINALSGVVLNNTFESYDWLLNQTAGIEENLTNITRKSANISLYYFAKGQISILKESDFICEVQNNCKKDASISELVIEVNKSFEKGEFSHAGKVEETCSMLKSISQSFAKTRNETLEKININSIVIPTSAEFKGYAEQKKLDVIKSLDKKYLESFNETIKNNTINASVIEIFEEFVSKDTDFASAQPNPPFEENATIYLLSKINLSDESKDYMQNICGNMTFNFLIKELKEYSLPILRFNEFYNITPRINTDLSASISICCVFGKCGKCCNTDDCSDDPRSYPVILVHGHSIRKSNSPDYSFDTFDMIQYRLQNEGYLNAGALLFADDSVKQGDWGLSGKPITVKVSYYFDVYRKEDQYVVVPAKSESIDTYALRLNDIVNLVKERTGKSKVNVIAFSMGGLVARKYMQIFGDGSVHKAVTIGTPHQGVIGKVAGLCPVLGESKECADMQKGSLFLNKLNDPSRQPKNAKIYNIIGRGCVTNGKESDGIVLTEFASLKGVAEAKEFYVNGTCEGTLVFFHKDIINIDKYPEVYELVVKALKD